MAINTQMRSYDYYTFGENNAYGQPALSDVLGTVKMAINFASTAIQENPLYSGTQYTGLTLNKNVNDTYVIQYGEEQLKVLYTNPLGKYNQVFLARM